MVFGGYISALADYAAGSAMLTVLEDADIFFTKKLEIRVQAAHPSGKNYYSCRGRNQLIEVPLND